MHFLHTTEKHKINWLVNESRNIASLIMIMHSRVFATDCHCPPTLRSPGLSEEAVPGTRLWLPLVPSLYAGLWLVPGHHTSHPGASDVSTGGWGSLCPSERRVNNMPGRFFTLSPRTLIIIMLNVTPMLLWWWLYVVVRIRRCQMQVMRNKGFQDHEKSHLISIETLTLRFCMIEFHVFLMILDIPGFFNVLLSKHP